MPDGLVLHSKLPDPPWLDPQRWRLPGILPLPPEDWIVRDETFAKQMTLRDRLISEQPSDVHMLMPSAMPAARECYEAVLSTLRRDEGYQFNARQVLRPDGVTVSLDEMQPLLTLGRLIQSDLCLMQTGEKGHVLTGAILCFPAYWTLSEKVGRGLARIHGTVDEYDENVQRRVQRLFDAIRPERALWRSNANLRVSGDLFTPKREGAPESPVGVHSASYVRSERQVLRKLPQTGVIVFSIHTYMIRVQDLDHEARSTLDRLDHAS